jgi:hypothetical protein
MKKLPVLIVLLVFGLSFIGASSAFGQSDRLPDWPETYYLEEPNTPTNDCYVKVVIKKNSLLEKINGRCEVDRRAQPISNLNLKVGDSPATLSSPVWIYYSSSPGRYCYVHPVTGQYQCIYW